MSNLKSKVLDLLNKQVNIELGNAALYRQLSAIANKLGFLNTETKLKEQYEDELKHFNKVLEYILDRNCDPIISQIVTPTREAKSLKNIFEIALQREQETTAELKIIRQTAINSDDQLTEVFMNEMLAEQIEEEKTIYDILAMLTAAGPNNEFLVDMKIGD